MAEASQANIDALTSQVRNMNQQITQVNNNIENVSTQIRLTNNKVENLAAEFQRLMKEQERRNAIQQATTELVRVRQELEQKYGNYQIVRNSMLGVLQATDSALVRKTTIANVSEELMLSTPKYWLAPCLVAVSAWISNDRDLAMRAITEAMRRDDEKTALVMALICRRNNRIDTCYEWLAIYFSKQNGNDFSESSFAYIDAYVNGIFGPDKKHICDDYINKWMSEVREQTEQFENIQENAWKDYYETFKVGTEMLYPYLCKNVKEFSEIDGFVGRINSLNNIYTNFDDIVNADVDQEALKLKIDKNLIELVSRYDEDETPLRNEERYYSTVKYYNGDTQSARAAIELAEEKNVRQTLNLLEQMMNCIKKKDTGVSQKRTAVSFLKPFLKKGFQSYVHEKRNSFPEYITISLNGWSGMTYDGGNAQELYGSYQKHMENVKVRELNELDEREPKKKALMGGIVSALALILFIVGQAIFGVAATVVAITLFVKSYSSRTWLERRRTEINQECEDKVQKGKDAIYKTLCEWTEARTVVYDFDRTPTRDVVA